MYRALLADARFDNLLLALDRDLAAALRAKGCARCGGVLHSAQFRRKPRGSPIEVDEGYDRRLSLCCAAELCRKRATPASLRFLGRKVFLGAVVVLVSALRHGAAPAVKELCDLVGVSRRTVGRWRRWWHITFVASPFWRVAAAAFMPPVGGAPAGLAAGALLRRRSEAPHLIAASAVADHRRCGDAGCMRGVADPQRMPVAACRGRALRSCSPP